MLRSYQLFHDPKICSRICAGILVVGALACLAPPSILRGQAVPEPGPSQSAQPTQSASPTAPAAPATLSPDDVALTVGDQKITAKEFEAVINNLPPEVASALPALGKRGFAERYANLLGLAKEGEKLKIDQGENFRQMAAFQRMMLLAQLTLGQMSETVGAVSPEEVSYYYTAHQLDFQQIKLRGIYIPFGTEAEAAAKPKPGSPAVKPKLTEAEARAKADALRTRINGGEDMAALAKKESTHASAPKGGDFGFVRHGQFTPQIDNVIFGLEMNQVSVPVRDRFGFFIFRVEEKRTQPLEEAKALIEPGLRQQKIGDSLTKVQTEYPATLDPRYFGPPAPANPPMPPAPK